jgi:hypothetical protein
MRGEKYIIWCQPYLLVTCRVLLRARNRWRRFGPPPHIQLPVYLAVVKEGKKLSDFDFLNQNAKDMLNQLSWWTNALRGIVTLRNGRRGNAGQSVWLKQRR